MGNRSAGIKLGTDAFIVAAPRPQQQQAGGGIQLAASAFVPAGAAFGEASRAQIAAISDVAQGAASGLGQGVTLGFGDELAGGVGAIFGKILPESLGGAPPGTPFGELMQESKEFAREDLRKAQAASPKVFAAAEIAGGAAIPVPGGTTAVLGRRVVQAGAEGIIQAVGVSEEDLLTSKGLRAARKNLLMGAAISSGLSGIIPGGARVTQALAKKTAAKADQFRKAAARRAAFGGPQKGEIQKLRQASSGLRGKLTQVEEFLVRPNDRLQGARPVEAGQSIETIAANLHKIKNSIGQDIQAATQKLDQAVANAQPSILQRNGLIDPTGKRGIITGDEAAKVFDDAIQDVKGVSSLSDEVKDALNLEANTLHTKAVISFEDLRTDIKEFGEAAFAKSLPGTPASVQGIAKKKWSLFKTIQTRAITRAEEILPELEGVGMSLKKANAEFSEMADVAEISAKGGDGEMARRLFGLGGSQAAILGGAAADAAGLGRQSLPIQALSFAAERLGRRRGASTAAGAAGTVSKIAQFADRASRAAHGASAVSRGLEVSGPLSIGRAIQQQLQRRQQRGPEDRQPRIQDANL